MVRINPRGGFGDRIMRSAMPIGSPWYVERNSRDRYIFNMRFRAPRGIINLSDDLLSFGRRHAGFVIVEPHIKAGVSGLNKDWGWDKWQALVDQVQLPWAQFDYGGKILGGVHAIKTESFWHGAAVLSVSKRLITTDGGLHHAAAALGLKAIVIWGGYAPPTILGYDDHINLSVDAPDCLGMKKTCEACAKAMAEITVEDAAKACKIWL